MRVGPEESFELLPESLRVPSERRDYDSFSAQRKSKGLDVYICVHSSFYKFYDECAYDLSTPRLVSESSFWSATINCTGKAVCPNRLLAVLYKPLARFLVGIIAETVGSFNVDCGVGGVFGFDRVSQGG